MRTLRRLFLTSAQLLLIVVLLLPAASTAATWDKVDPPPEPTGLEKRLTKFGRGLANTAFGWMEIPVTVYAKQREGKRASYLFCVAPVLGVSRTLSRTGIGVVEMLTFPVSWGVADFGPLIEPEYIP